MASLVTFAKKLWKDATSGGTPITAAELNRMESGINDCATQINRLGNSVSLKVGFRNQAVSASVGGDMSYERPQPIQIAVKTPTSDCVLCILMDGISLYNNKTEKVIWSMSAK
jgi:subtilase family serine protease